jgi:hypothetical protein
MTEQTNTETDQTTTENVPEKVQTETEDRTYSKADVEKKMNNFIRQINEYKAKEEKREEDARKAEKAKLEKKGELEKLIEAERAEKQELLNQLAAQRLASEKSTLEAKLIEAGIADSMARRGWSATYFEQEERPDVEAWIKAQKEANPDAFKPQSQKVNSVPVGSVKQSGPTDSLEARLSSPDRNVRKAAEREEFLLIAKGELKAD